MWREMGRFGRKLVEGGLVESHFGNISLRVGSRMIITRSGSALDEITVNDVVEVDLYRHGSLDLIASSELRVHRAIYQHTSALAVIHAHCPYAVVLSLLEEGDSVVPVDSEGRYFLHEIPLVSGGIGSRELAENTARALEGRKGVIVRGHGTFAVGKILEEAYVVTTQIEHACRVKYLVELAGRKGKLDC